MADAEEEVPAEEAAAAPEPEAVAVDDAAAAVEEVVAAEEALLGPAHLDDRPHRQPIAGAPRRPMQRQLRGRLLEAVRSVRLWQGHER